MSFRELRDFTEIMRNLGYQRLISLENFRTPNFELVADVLYWMVKRYDPAIGIPDSIESEEDRVEFLTVIAHQMYSKAQITLNAKRLYAADGHAVKELLKLATMLHKAARTQVQDADAKAEEAPTVSKADASRVPDDVKRSRELSSEILSKGARLHDLLASEQSVRTERMQALRFLDSLSGARDGSSESRFVENSVRELLAMAQENMEGTKKQYEDLRADEKALDSKIKRRKQDLERQEKRLRSLQTVRPAFMDEYERLEEELQAQYEAYIQRYRNLEYLENELDTYAKAEKEQAQESERKQKRFQKKMRQFELELLRGEKEIDDIVISNEDHYDDGGAKMEGSGKMDDAGSEGEDTEDSEDLSQELSNESGSLEGSEMGSQSESNLMDDDEEGSLMSGEEGGFYGGDSDDSDEDNF
eukprot:CAMPEP_0118857682 /NCGR_PEP_ID=MMETSP1163-20130328/4655_1 /TAXON_ID=124430 /ORGANISM="Phaeomonas parva, Strain CCMP2877" /LENGTH=416 /DNA_ID=CAMNT_0006791019 /DNA_START=224 /DNA_END=1474 /DNA_ORIENTATION=+